MPKASVKSSDQPPAVGYIRLDDHDDSEFAVLLKDIATCCLREGLRLVRTFYDRGYDGSQLARAGIVEVQEALRQTPGLVVVVPTLGPPITGRSNSQSLDPHDSPSWRQVTCCLRTEWQTRRLRRHAIRGMDWPGRGRALVMTALWWVVGALAVVLGLWFGLLVWTSSRDQWPHR